MRIAVVTVALAALIGGILIAGSSDELGPNPFVVLGVVQGAVYGLVAIGLVLVYKGARVFNFAQGEFGTVAAYSVFLGIERYKLPYWLAIIVSLVLVMILGLGMERALVRPQLNSPRIILLVTTIAFALLLIGFQVLFSKAQPYTLQPLFQQTQGQGVELFGFTIGWQQLLGVGVLGAVGAGLAYFFARTDLGLAVLATSQDAFATRVVGIGVERMSRFIWASAALLGGIAGILFVPTSGTLIPAIMTTSVLIPAFVGAVLGGMTSLPGAFIGGTVVGLVQNLTKWAANNYFLGDRPWGQVVPAPEWITMFLVLLVILLARPQGLLGKEA